MKQNQLNSRLFGFVRLLFLTVFFAGLSLNALPLPEASAASSGLVISQVYGGGGNTGATYTNDFIELFNRGTAPVALNGYTVQYYAANGNAGSSTGLTAGTLNPGQYFLIQGGQRDWRNYPAARARPDR